MTAIFSFSVVNSIELSNLDLDFKTYLAMERSLHKIHCISTCMKNYRGVKLCNMKGAETKRELQMIVQMSQTGVM